MWMNTLLVISYDLKAYFLKVFIWKFNITGSKKVPDLKAKKCSQFEIEEKRKQALRKLMKKKCVSRKWLCVYAIFFF